MTETTITVGKFQYDTTTGELAGPAAFMESTDFADWKRRFAAGTDVVFRSGMEHSPSPEVAMLVSVQTCFAGWHGMETFNRARGVA
jgi:hypothetical protein